MIRTIDEANCTNCGLCVDICQMDVIRMKQPDGKVYIAYAEDCFNCRDCEFLCPYLAITVEDAMPAKFNLGMLWGRMRRELNPNAVGGPPGGGPPGGGPPGGGPPGGGPPGGGPPGGKSPGGKPPWA